eukprot:TRINITY_DN7801_c1_g1_i1.p1 TRINITY_DN7801_c1_g1~~TRINITY_DN7801_c1_g1_i1.p1  ORF type:complete len:1607 (+),score=483.52 TRINITY_DN7801_c1_g1_i1:421-5241(+)
MNPLERRDRHKTRENAFFAGAEAYKCASPKFKRSSRYYARGSFFSYANSLTNQALPSLHFESPPSTPSISFTSPGSPTISSPSQLNSPSITPARQNSTIARYMAAFSIVFYRHLGDPEPRQLSISLKTRLDLPNSDSTILISMETTILQLVDNSFGVILPMSLAGISDQDNRSLKFISMSLPDPESEKDFWTLSLDLNGRNGMRDPKISFEYPGAHSAIRKFFPMQVKSVADQCLVSSHLKVSQVQFLAEDEIVLLSRFTSSPFRLEEQKETILLHQFFEKSCDNYPTSTALVWEEMEYSYEWIDIHSNQLASILFQQGLRPKTFVGIFMAKSVELYLSILAILKLGAAYVPLDLSFPPDRVKFILQDCNAQFLLVRSALPSLLESWEGKGLNVINLLEEHQDEEMPIPEISREKISGSDYAYVIYTSGTTGLPKGVLITHDNISHLVRSEHLLFETGNRDRVAQGFSVAFDASLEELWMAWAAGGALVPVPEETMKAPDALPSFIVKNKINVFSTVPTLLSLLEHIPSLRLLILGGEVCPQELLVKWHSPLTRIINSYGPTEATVVSTAADYTPGVKLTIGRPIPGYQIMVLDQFNQLAPLGAPGELCIGGRAVAAGYLNRKELTDSKFKDVEHPLPNGFKGRIYRTGDLVRLTETGTVEFLGRIDTQVKIRGFRVELSEIESLLLQCEGIRNSAVAVKESNGIQKLVAYLILHEEAKEKSSFSEESVKAFLRTRLAPYMVPTHYVILPQFPLLTSGKVDRKQLPEPSGKSNDSNRNIIAPEGAIQVLLHSAWVKYLAMEEICITEDFFALGGNSLLASMVVSHLRQLAPFRGISVKDIYQHRTIKALSVSVMSTLSSELLKEYEKESAPESAQKREDGSVAIPMPSSDDSGTSEPHGGAAPPHLRRFTSFLQLFLMFYSIVIGIGMIQLVLVFRERLDIWWYVMMGGLIFFSTVFYIPAACLTSILFKWVFIGRFEPGVHPLWGWYYFRFWFAKLAMGAAPVGLLSSTPFLGYYYRLMGAKIGDNVYIGSTRISCFDLLEIKDGACIAKEACLMGYRIEGGKLIISGRITIGTNGYVGLRSVVEGNASVGDHSSLGDLSVLMSGTHVPPQQSWNGSPAQFTENNSIRNNECKVTTGYLFKQYLAFWLVGFIPVLPIAISVASYVTAYFLLSRVLTPNYLIFVIMFALIFPTSGLYVLLTMLNLVFYKRIVAGKSKNEVQLYGEGYIRHWIGEVVLSMSLTLLKSIYATIYAPYWMRALGAKIGKGAEVSTVNHISSDHLIVEDNAFLADSTSVGAPRIQYGIVKTDSTVVGEKTFIGNSAVMAGGTILGKNCLIGALSVSPAQMPPDNTNWVGSPSFLIPSRAISTAYGSNLTFSPPLRLILFRAFVELFKIGLPHSFVSLTVLPWFFFCIWQLMHFPWWRCWIQAIALALGLLGFFTFLTVLLKWILVGRYRTMERPLWSSYVWRNELINSLCESYVFPFVVNPLLGTPFAPFFFRLMGSHIGDYVYMDTTEITEFDLVWIADYVCLNNGVTLQTHLFEDRIMKMSHLKIGRNSTIGTSSVVLYDTVIGPNVSLRSLSLVMKGESLPGDTCWQGIPCSFLGEQ